MEIVDEELEQGIAQEVIEDATTLVDLTGNVISEIGQIPQGEGWFYYLCDMIRPVPIRLMVEFIRLNMEGVEWYLPYHKDIYLLENYFCLVIKKQVTPQIRRKLSSYFWVKKEVKIFRIEQFINSLKEGDKFVTPGSKVIVPLYHRHLEGEIVEELPNAVYRVKFEPPRYDINDPDDRKDIITVNRCDLQIPYVVYDQYNKTEAARAR